MIYVCKPKLVDWQYILLTNCERIYRGETRLPTSYFSSLAQFHLKNLYYLILCFKINE